ncbi:MAG: hypothetical protein U0X39_10995 [Bacteroidales bacterium]
MIKAAGVIVLLILFSSAKGQNSNIDQLTRDSKSGIPADKVFLHVDRNLYKQGDTIRFTAYIRDRQTGIYETKSSTLICMVISPASKTADSSRFRISGATASGWLHIPVDATPGIYSVTAFTANMMNYNNRYVFRTPVKVEKQGRPGKSNTEILTSRQTENTKELTSSDLRIDFLPEGGNLITGFRQRIGFNATTTTGKQLFINGKITDQEGNDVTTFESGINGPGFFEITPVVGKRYMAIVKIDKSNTFEYQLPESLENGAGLRVEDDGPDQLKVTIFSRGAEFKKLLLTVAMNEVVVFSGNTEIDSSRIVRINTEMLPPGTGYVTLFDKSGRPLAERQVLVNKGKRLNIGILKDKTAYKPGGEASIDLQATDENGKNVAAVLSLSAFDSITGFSPLLPLADIRSTMDFDAGFLESLPLKIGLAGPANLTDKELETMLLVYGWRRFRDRESGDTIISREYNDFETIELTTRAEGKNRRDKIRITSLEALDMIEIKTTGGITEFNPDTLDSGARNLVIMPDPDWRKNQHPVLLRTKTNKRFAESVKSFSYQEPEEMKTVFTIRNEADYGLDTAVYIDRVTIKGNRDNAPKVYNKYQLMFQNTSAYTISAKDLTTAFTFEDVLTRLMPFMIDRKAKKVYLRTTGRGPQTPALFVVDDVPLWEPGITGTSKWLSSYVQIADMPASNISSVTMIKGLQGYPLYGEAALGGVIFVETKAKGMKDGTYEEVKQPWKEIKNDLAKPVRIYRSEIEFYIPAREEYLLNPEYQNRRTLLWKKEIVLDGSGPVSVKFPLNNTKGKIMITVNGVSVNNIPGSASKTLSVN